MNPSPRWQIIRSDCVEFLAGLEPGQARLIFADPPYNLGIDYGDHYDDRKPAADYLSWCAEWMAQAARILAPDGSFWVLISDE